MLGPLVAFFGTGYYSGFGAVIAELYPTSVRATAAGVCYNIGRIASAARRSSSARSPPRAGSRRPSLSPVPRICGAALMCDAESHLRGLGAAIEQVHDRFPR